jgi:hypothetical protein
MKSHAAIFAAWVSATGICQALQQIPGEPPTFARGNQPSFELNQGESASASSYFSASSPNVNSPEQALASHRLLKHFAVEARIDSVGEYKLEDSFDALQTQFATYTGNAIGILPFGDSGVELFGHVGAGWVADRMDRAFAAQESSSAVGTFGMGLRYVGSKSSPLSLIAGYDTYHFQSADKQVGRADLLLSKASLGLQYDF